MKVNKKVELGMKAIRILRKASKPVRSSQLAEEAGTTVAFMEQVMQNLHRAGLTKAIKGPGGGHLLREPHQIRAIDVASAVGQDMSVAFTPFTGVVEIQPEEQLAIAIQDAYRNTVV